MKKSPSENSGVSNSATLLFDYRIEAARLASAAEPSTRREALGRMSELWQTAVRRAGKAGLLPDQVDTFDRIHADLSDVAAEGTAAARNRATAQFTSTFERLTKALETQGTTAAPAARWIPQEPLLKKGEQKERLKKCSEQTRGMARTLAEAVRKVVAARRDHGVPLHDTVSNEVRTQYSQAAMSYAVGLAPQIPFVPPITKRNAPWGVFKVRSPVPPGQAAAHFALSPPLPARGELLGPRSLKTQLLPLPPVPADAGGSTRRSTNAPS